MIKIFFKKIPQKLSYIFIFLFLLLIGSIFYDRNHKNIPIASIVIPAQTEYGYILEECRKEILSKNTDIRAIKFENYRIDSEYSGLLAEPDINSHPLAKRYRTMIRNDVKNHGINFAGHYTIAQWGATGIGDFMAVVDRITGKVYPFPYVIKTGLKFQKNSALFIVDSVDDMLTTPCWAQEAKARTFYFIFDGSEFILIGPRDKQGPDVESYGWLDF